MASLHKTWLQVGIITLVCAGLYGGLRNIPYTECTFLHYQHPEVSEDGLEFCGEANPMYLDFTRLRYPVKLSVKADSPLVAGHDAALTLTLESDRGNTLHPHDIAVSHTELVHLLIADPSLDDYHHLHPRALGANGEWQVDFKPRGTGVYRVFAEFVLNRTRQKVVTWTDLEVSSAPNPDSADDNSVMPVQDDLNFTLTTVPAQITPNRDTQLTLTVSDPTGAPVELDPIMGALAHIVAFDEQRKGYAHLHPRFTGRERDPAPQLEFSFQTSDPGPYRVWAQMKIDGRQRLIPFDLVVR